MNHWHIDPEGNEYRYVGHYPNIKVEYKIKIPLKSSIDLHTKYICAKCKKEFDNTVKTYGGYAVPEMKNLCPECWKEYIEIKNRHNQELNKWWGK